MLTLPQLRAVMPRAPLPRLSAYLPYLDAALTEFEINTSARIAAFLAQLAHESGELRYMEEIASGAAYEGRKDLGNDSPGDGPRYKGRGPIQLTGRANYQVAGKALGLDLEQNPAQASQPAAAFRIAGWFWKSRALNGLADTGDFDHITRRINGGLNGSAERRKYWAAAKKALGVSDNTGSAGHIA